MVLAGLMTCRALLGSARAESSIDSVVAPVRQATPPSEIIDIEDLQELIENEVFSVRTDMVHPDVDRWRVAGLYSFDPVTFAERRNLISAEFLSLSRNVDESELPVLIPNGSIGDPVGFAFRGERRDVHDRNRSVELGIRVATDESVGSEPVGYIHVSTFTLPPMAPALRHWVLETESLLVDIDLNHRSYFNRAGFDLHLLYGVRGVYLRDAWQAGDMFGPPRALVSPRLNDEAYNVMAGGQVGVGVAKALARFTLGGTSKIALFGSNSDDGFGAASLIDLDLFVSLHINNRTELSVGTYFSNLLGVSTTLPAETVLADENSVAYAGVKTSLTYRF